jgi:hypothetical protein
MAVKETRQPTPVSGEEMNAYTAFVELHRPQLEQLPQQLWPVSNTYKLTRISSIHIMIETL